MKHLLAVFILLAACGTATSSPDGMQSASDGRQAIDAVQPNDGAQASDGAPGGDTANYTSGDRIKARVVTTPDGAKAHVGWRDTVLNINCAFANPGDGTTRCLPIAKAWIASFYSDALCAVPLAYSSAQNDCVVGAPLHAVRNSSAVATCNANEYFLIGGPHLGDLYGGDPANCYPTTGSDGLSFYVVGQPVPLSTFQMGAESLD